MTSPLLPDPPTTDAVPGSSPAGSGNRVARWLSAVFHPVLTGAYVLLGAGILDASSPMEGLAWSLFTIVLATGIPACDLLLRLRTGRVTSLDVALREQRHRPLLVTLACCLIALALLVALGGPDALIVALLAALASGAALAAVTRRWKISFHTAVLAGGIVILGWAAGTGMLAALPLVGVVGWARVTLGRHTIAQVVAGAAVGGAVSVVVVALV